MVDTADLKSVDRKVVGVRIPLSAPRAYSSMAEQGAHNALVLGSSPGRPTNLNSDMRALQAGNSDIIRYE